MKQEEKLIVDDIIKKAKKTIKKRQNNKKYQKNKKYKYLKLITNYQHKKKGDIVKVSIQTAEYLIKELIAIIPEQNEIIDEQEYDSIEDLKNTFFDKKTELKFEVNQLIALKQRAEATEKIVEYLHNKAIFKTTKIDEKNEIWVYKNGIYEPQGRCYIQEESRKILGELHTTQIINVIIGKIEADTFIDQDEFFNQQNEYPEIIPILNGLLNVKTKELKPFNHQIAYFNKIPINFKPGVKCIKFEKFLKEITKHENDIKVIQELFGYCLYKEYKYKKSFMFEGGGDNGKSQLLKILTEKFLGIENTKNISLAQMEKDTYLMSELHNKLVNVSGDITSNVLDNTGNFKNLTGGDPVSFSRKFKNSITIVNYAKMIFATNELPISKDNSLGFWGRWCLIEFPHKFLVKKEYDLLNDVEKKNVKIATPNIINEIIDEQELTGMLNWALEGFERLERQKEFSYNKSREETKKKWLMKSNSVLAFIDECIEEDYDSYILKSDFKQYYLRYCSDNKLKRKSDSVIKISIENELSAFSEKKYVMNEQKHIWSGIKFKHKKDQKDQKDHVLNSKPFFIKTLGNENPVLSVLPVLSYKRLNNIFYDYQKKMVTQIKLDKLLIELHKNFNFEDKHLEPLLLKFEKDNMIQILSNNISLLGEFRL